jgi:hypothetical protein
MRIFRELLQDQQVQNIVERAYDNSNVQGVLLEVNPLWMYLYRLQDKFSGKWLNDKFEFYHRFYGDFFPFQEHFFEKFILDLAKVHLDNDFWIPKQAFGKIQFEELNYKVGGFLRHIAQERNTNFKPFVVRVCLYPNYNNEVFFETSNESIFEIIVEPRPISYLFNNSQNTHRPLIGGISIGVDDNSFGTLGAVFVDKSTNKYYGLTCSHVVKNIDDVYQPAPYDNSSKYSKIGKVIHKSILKPLSVNDYTNRSLKNSNEVDIAVIEIFENVDLKILGLGRVTGIFSENNIVPYLNIEFVGRSSGHKPYLFTDAFAVFYDFEHDNEKYRYKDLLQIQQNGKINNFLSTPTSSGDSGACVCMPNQNGFAWGGMVIGGFAQIGYVVTSEKIDKWIKDETNIQLDYL